jgi:hypothetical protein
MNPLESKETIQLAVLDSVLYGAAKAVDYLGMRGQVMLDKIGEGILDYFVKVGYIRDRTNFDDVVEGLDKFFQENGYVTGVGIALEDDTATFTFRGWEYLGVMRKLRSEGCTLYSCPLCLPGMSFMRSKSIVMEPISEYFLPDGAFVRKYKCVNANPNAAPSSMMPPNAPDLGMVKPNPEGRVGLEIFEAVEYGLARGFEYLGAQAQLLLDHVGRGVIEFLQDELQVDLAMDHCKSIGKLSTLYASEGLADKIEPYLSGSEMRVRFQNYRYSLVLERLLKEDVQLISCPFTLATRAILRDAGFAVRKADWTIDAGRDVQLSMSLTKLADKSFDEDRVASLMDSV